MRRGATVIGRTAASLLHAFLCDFQGAGSRLAFAIAVEYNHAHSRRSHTLLQEIFTWRFSKASLHVGLIYLHLLPQVSSLMINVNHKYREPDVA